jgi:hypothetical protein
LDIIPVKFYQILCRRQAQAYEIMKKKIVATSNNTNPTRGNLLGLNIAVVKLITLQVI